MKIGAFSISLNVKSINLSKEFYEKLGFEKVGGVIEQKWLIMRNGETTIGLFQGMFESNIMTFNPGWDAKCETLESFEDVREICENLEKDGIEVKHKSLNEESGPGSFSITDPEGNTILFDQHV